MLLLKTGDLCELLCILPKRLDRLISAGAVTPTFQGHGRGRHHAFTMINLMAVGLFLSMESNGCSVVQCRAASRWIQSQGWDAIAEQIERGESYLVVAGTVVRDTLLSADDARKVGDVLRRARNRPIPVVFSDLAGPFKRLCQMIEDQASVEVAR